MNRHRRKGKLPAERPSGGVGRLSPGTVPKNESQPGRIVPRPFLAWVQAPSRRALDPGFALFPHEPMARGQFFHPLPDGKRGGHIFIKEVTAYAFAIDRVIHFGMREQGFRLGAEDEPTPRRFRVIERLLAHPIAGEYQPSASLVPDRERVHAIQGPDEIRTFFFVKMDQAFGIGRRAITVPSRQQTGSYLEFIVELAVIGDPDRAVLIGHRLGASFEIDDGEATMPKRHGTVAVEAIAVRASMCQLGRHPDQEVKVGGKAFAIHETGDPAHVAQPAFCLGEK